MTEDLQRRGIGFRSLTEGLDTGTTMGRFVITIMAGMAQMERELIAERRNAGIAAARARGRNGGRPHRLTPRKIDALRAILAAPAAPSVGEAAAALGVSRATAYRALGRRAEEMRRNRGAASPGGHNLPPGIDSLREARNQRIEENVIAAREKIEGAYTGKRQYIRVERGQLFNAARKLLTKADFKVWIKNEFCGRSISDAYACMKLARADDTEAAVVAERVGSAERKRKSRANLSVTGADVTDKPEANIVPFVPSGGFTPRPLTPAADRPTMPGYPAR